MIAANFFILDGRLTGFSVSGHALYDTSGSDIVCAAVSSAVQLAANGITEIAGAEAEISVEENRIVLRTQDTGETSQAFLQALKLQLTLVSQQYPDTISITISEV